MSLEEVLALTIPQLQVMEECLMKICKAENGENPDALPKGEGNTIALAQTIKMLREKTGRTEFTMEEALDPMGTLKKYKKV